MKFTLDELIWLLLIAEYERDKNNLQREYFPEPYKSMCQSKYMQMAVLADKLKSILTTGTSYIEIEP